MTKEQWRLEKEQLVRNFRVWNERAQKGGIVFAGSSLMEMFPIEEWIKELGADAPVVYNRGVGGYTTVDYGKILDVCIYDLAPRKIFINIGTNDLSNPTMTMEDIMVRYDDILTQIERKLPEVQIYMMAYYPVNYDAATEQIKSALLIRTNEKISMANKEMEKLAVKHHQKFINVNAPLTDEQGRLKAEYTIEGMHIKQEGYRAIFPDIVRYIKE